MKNKLKKSFVVFLLLIPVFLGGSAVGLYVMNKQITEEARWAINNPKEAKWAMDRQTLVKKAAEVLYFEDTNEGMTIIKPYTKNVEN